MNSIYKKPSRLPTDMCVVIPPKSTKSTSNTGFHLITKIAFGENQFCKTEPVQIHYICKICGRRTVGLLRAQKHSLKHGCFRCKFCNIKTFTEQQAKKHSKKLQTQT